MCERECVSERESSRAAASTSRSVGEVGGGRQEKKESEKGRGSVCEREFLCERECVCERNCVGERERVCEKQKENVCVCERERAREKGRATAMLKWHVAGAALQVLRGLGGDPDPAHSTHSHTHTNPLSRTLTHSLSPTHTLILSHTLSPTHANLRRNTSQVRRCKYCADSEETLLIKSIRLTSTALRYGQETAHHFSRRCCGWSKAAAGGSWLWVAGGLR